MAKLRRIKTGNAFSPPGRTDLAQRQMKSSYIRTVKRRRVSSGSRNFSSNDDKKDVTAVSNGRNGNKKLIINRSANTTGSSHAAGRDELQFYSMTGDKNLRTKAGRDALVKRSEKRRLVRRFSADAAMYVTSEIRNGGPQDYDSGEPAEYAENQIGHYWQYAVHTVGRSLGSSTKWREKNPQKRSSTLANKRNIAGVRGMHAPMQNAGSSMQNQAFSMPVTNRASSATACGRSLAIREYAKQTGGNIRSSIQVVSRAIKAMIEASKSEATAISFAGLGSTVVLVIISVVLVLAMTISSSFGEYNLELSDNDLVNIALSQVGTESGEAYCKWYGFDREVGWCAIFVSWCGTEAGLVKKGLMPKFAWVPTGVYWFQAREQWHSNDYSPQPGDIIFFDWYDYDLDEDGEEIGQDGSADHVGIVEKVEGGYVYTVEGNTTQDGICAEKRYPLGYFEILGYGEILYPDD